MKLKIALISIILLNLERRIYRANISACVKYFSYRRHSFTIIWKVGKRHLY